jgi:hypothetical protein
MGLRQQPAPQKGNEPIFLRDRLSPGKGETNNIG